MTDTSKTAKIIKSDITHHHIAYLSLHVAINKCINWCFVHLYLLFYYKKNNVFLLLVNYNPSVFHGHDLDLLGSRFSPLCREAPNGRICTKFCTAGRLADVGLITCFKFCVDWLKGVQSTNFAILHWLSRSKLTQGCATARLWFHPPPKKKA